ncbi:MAG TPA: flagellar protein FhlB [Rhodospirillaceae bacterium]|nr:flagellar protein FhlB [Rhodospirillaceae bacterium]
MTRFDKDHTPTYRALTPKNGQNVAVAITANESRANAPAEITAAGRGVLADQIVEIALANGVKVREDCALAELLAQLDLDTPIPSEAIVLVAEILAKVYESNEAASSFQTHLDSKGV